MDARVPTHGPDRIGWLDALRGWAVFGVVMVHSGQVAHATGITGQVSATGQYGVQLFFIVSALTISMTYNSHISQFGASAQSQLAWLTKRFFRIAPLYYFAALFYPLEQYSIYLLTGHRYGSAASTTDILANFLFLHTWIPSANNSVVPGGWSIGVEMFFYILVPFIWLLTPLRRRILVLSGSAIGFLLITLLAGKLTTGTSYVENNTYLYYWLPAQAPVLILGLIFYVLHRSKIHPPQTPQLTAVCLAAALAFALLAIYLGTGEEVAPVFAPTMMAVSFLFLIVSLQGRIMQAIANKYAIFLGTISFSVYIFHFVVLDAIRFLLQVVHLNRSGPLMLLGVFVTALAGTSMIALASKRFIEEPAIIYGHKLSRAMMRLAPPRGQKRVAASQ